MYRYRLSYLGALFTAILWAGSTLAQADVARITSINGTYQPNRATPYVDVIPGQVVNLTADLVNEYDFTQGENQYAQNFTWAASDRDGDSCDLSQNQDCFAYSSFQANNYGVSFYVPGNAGAEIVITVRSNQNGTQDSIVLKNTLYDPSGVAPVIITDASQYPYSTFDSHRALYGQGNWVVIDGDNYFVPYSYANGWEPYQNGYWSNASEGYTWVSYDPWGWVTDHYGVWRHHGVYGWVWLPFERPEYHPCAVSFFYGDSGYIGWYPYHAGFAYRSGYAVGFDDGYWAGYDAGAFYGRDGYHPGFTVVRQDYFGRENIWDVRETDVTVINRFYGDSYRGKFYGKFPGGPDLESSRQWIGDRHVVIPEDHSIEIAGRGGVQVREPAPIHDVPAQYRNVIDTRPQIAQQRVPIGSQVRPGNDGRPEVIPPSTNGTGIAHAPIIKDPRTGEQRPMAPVNQRPVAPNANNPVYHPIENPVQRPVQDPVQRPVQDPVQRPVQDPVQRPIQDPVQRPVQDPVQRPVQQPVQRPVQDPVQRPVQDPVQRPVQNPVQRPVQQPVQRPVQQPVQRPYTPPVQQPVQRPYTPPVQQPVQRPYTPPVQQPVQRPYTPPVQQPVQRPYTPPVQQPVQRPYTPPVQQPVQRPYTPPVQQPAPQPVQRPYTPPVQQPAPQPVQRPYSPPVQQPSQQPRPGGGGGRPGRPPQQE